MTLPFTRAAEQPKVTTCFSASFCLNIHPLNYPGLQRWQAHCVWRGTLCRYLRGSPCISLGLSVLPFNLLLYFRSVSPHPSVLALSYTFFSSLLEELGAFSCSFGDRDLNSAAGSDCSGMAAPSSKEHSSVLQFCFVGVFL